MKLEEIHDCEKCHSKIVAITVDTLGNTYCGYCGQRVDYSAFFKEIEKEMKLNEFINKKMKKKKKLNGGLD